MLHYVDAHAWRNILVDSYILFIGWSFLLVRISYWFELNIDLYFIFVFILYQFVFYIRYNFELDYAVARKKIESNFRVLFFRVL